ncbi:hypothetical protein ABZ769_17240 [Streptomyces olivoreticuli]
MTLTDWRIDCRAKPDSAQFSSNPELGRCTGADHPADHDSAASRRAVVSATGAVAERFS